MLPTAHDRSWLAVLLVILTTAWPAAAAQEAPTALTLAVDARQAPSQILHARLTVPAEPGPLTLVYPKWIPGEHGPTGPVQNLTGLEFWAGERLLRWERDPTDLYSFHLTVPAGVEEITVAMDYLIPASGEGFTAGPSATPQLAVLNWNQVVLYPQGVPADQIGVRPRLHLPQGWSQATALSVSDRDTDVVSYEPVTLSRLIDSPVLIGRHVRSVELTSPDRRPHAITIAADSTDALELPHDFARDYSRLVAEAGALFGARHYRRYEWLVALSDGVDHFGLEHHESSDNRMGERTLLEEAERHDLTGLLTHEFVHSWNGKHRRPAGMVRRGYQQPKDTSLLWVYEGLTSYLDTILPARAGLWTGSYTREAIAELAAVYSHRAGREWRPLGDTARAARELFGASKAGRSWRRGVDFYGESVLIWMEADAIIRRQTGGERSLDDFCRLFHGGETGAPTIAPYTREELIQTLDRVASHDWDAFFDERIGQIAVEPPLAGLEAAGWRLVYTGERNLVVAEEHPGKGDWRFSLGVVLKDDEIQDVYPGLPAAEAGIAPGMRIVAVNDRAFTDDRLDAAVDAAARQEGPIRLLVEDEDHFTTHELEHHRGLRYPHLERIEGTPDLLSQILAPRTWEPERD